MSTLSHALDTHLGLLRELHALLKRETGEMSEVHLDAMAEINARKDELAERIQIHAGTLRVAIGEAAAQEGLAPKATLGELAIRFKQKGDTGVARLHAELNTAAAEVKELLNLNREIAERFSASVGNSLDFLTRIINQTSTYGASGGYQQRPAGAVLVNREA